MKHLRRAPDHGLIDGLRDVVRPTRQQLVHHRLERNQRTRMPFDAASRATEKTLDGDDAHASRTASTISMRSASMFTK